MAEIIEEIPIEPASAAAPEEIQEDIQEIKPTIPEKKGRGRPAGSKNKPKEAAPKPSASRGSRAAKAKPKPKARPVEEEHEEESSSEEEERPPPRRRAKQAVAAAQPLDRRALAAEVLDLLQQQRYSRASARRDHYASWFQNM